MGMENIRQWPASAVFVEDRTGTLQPAASTNGTLAAINSVSVNGSQMQAAIEAIEHALARSEAEAMQHRIMADFARQYGIGPTEYASSALHARVTAMLRWRNHYDPQGQTDGDAFFEAGARCPIIETIEGTGFDPEAFAELLYFITELPF